MRFSRSLLAAATTLATISVPAHAQTEIQWWHSMTGGLNDWVLDLANGFNASQKDYKIVPTYKGTYDETMPAAVAAFRAGNAPHILQVFEVGTATMMAAKGAVVPVGKVLSDAGYKFDPKAYIPAVVGYYTAPNGQMLSFPFNSSTTVFYYQQGRCSRKPPAWTPQPAAHHLARGGPGGGQAQGFSGHKCPFTTSLARLDPAGELLNLAQRRTRHPAQRPGRHQRSADSGQFSPLHVRHIENLANMAKQGLFVYKGRANKCPKRASYSGECAMISRPRRRLLRRTWQEERQVRLRAWPPLPYYPDVAGRAAEHRDRRRQSLWVLSWQESAPSTRAWPPSSTSCPTPRCSRPKATSAPATCPSPRPSFAADRAVGLLQAEAAGHRHRRQPDDPQDHRQVARHPPGQLHPGARHSGRRTGAGLGWQEVSQGSFGCHRQPRQRTAGTFPEGQLSPIRVGLAGRR